MGLTLSNPTPEVRDKYGLADSTVRAVVVAIDPKFDEIANLLKEGDAVMFLIGRGGDSFYVAYNAGK